MIPAHERRILEAHVRKVPLSRLALENAERPLNEYEQRELKELIKLRMRGMPLQYLTGSQGFYGREFYVNTAVLVPRPETEGLVELVLKELPAPHLPLPGEAAREKLEGLELGAGSGCISITIALERADVHMTATECSEAALEVAAENLGRTRTPTGSVHFVQVSEQAELAQYEDLPLCDFLVSNPPYLLSDDEIADDVRSHEPPEALFARKGDSLYFYKFLADLMESKVKPGGFGAFEIASQRAQETLEIFQAHKFDARILKDLPGNDRYVIAKKTTDT